MITTCDCPACGQRIEFEAENAGTVIQCPNCQKEITLPAPVVAPPVVAVAVSGRTAKEYVSKLREETCYGALRAIINVIFIFGIVATVLGVIGYAVTLPLGGIAITIFVALVGTALSFLLLIAARQAAFVLIDIADALIYQGNSTFKKA